MSFIRTVIVLSLMVVTTLWGVSTCIHAAELDTSKRVAVINTVIMRGNILAQGDAMLKMARESSDPIHLVVNSPGGDVITGFMFINQMEAVRSKGVRIKCYVPQIAASMAFQILLHCDERTALSKAFLLWHGVRIQMGGGFMTQGATVTAGSARQLAADMELLDEVILRELDATLGLSEEDVRYHFSVETLHVAENLHALTPSFLKIADAIPGLLELITTEAGAGDDGTGGGLFREGEIIYIRSLHK